MKNKLLFTVLLLFVVFLFSSFLLAQDNSQTFFVIEDNVKPGQEKKYVEAAKKQVELLEKYDFKYPTYTYSTFDNLYYWVTPIENLAELDGVFKDYELWEAKLKEKNELDIREAYRGTFSHLIIRTIVKSSELSYKPAEPRLEEGKRAFLRWWFCYLYADQSEEFSKKQRKYVDYFEKANAISGFDTYWGMMGAELPLIIFIESYKDEMDMLNTRKELFGSLDPEVFELWEDMKQHIRRIEVKTGWFRPGLSYIPEN